MVDYKILRKEVSLSTNESNLVSFDDDVKFTVKYMGPELWKVERIEGNFTLMGVLDKSNIILFFFCLTYSIYL